MSILPIRLVAGLGLCIAALLQPASAGALEIVASIKPVHSLVAALTEGAAEPTLLIKAGGSPHVHALRPSEAQALERAEIVFWVGEELETFLVRPLRTLAADARIVTLIEAYGLDLLAAREGGAWEGHDHEGHVEAGEHGHEDEHEAEHEAGHEADHEHEHEVGELDMHIWLDPRNGAAMAEAITAALVEADPDNAPVYRANLARLVAGLAALERSLAESLEPVRDRPFVVFHDGYHYFERRFNLNAVGSITVSPETQPGAARLRELRETITSAGAHCVFSEPQFEPRLLETVIEGTGAAAGVLDPLGAALPAGPETYFALLRNLAGSLVDCLGDTGSG